ncbi:MAG: hypothetical protein R3E58_17575 [Phycisphaerae bacterium]
MALIARGVLVEGQVLADGRCDNDPRATGAAWACASWVNATSCQLRLPSIMVTTTGSASGALAGTLPDMLER